MSTRTLYSVIQVTNDSGETFCRVDWHPDLEPALERYGHEGAAADYAIDFAEELLHLLEDDDE